MKNIAFLKFFFIILNILSAVNPVFCQEDQQNLVQQNRKYGFTVGGGFGVLNGQALELVYSVPGETNGEFLSELIWEMKPVLYAGINADFGLTDILSGPGFFSSLAIKAGIPGKTGIMEDRDWMSVENDALTHFSSHENKTNALIWIDLYVGASIPIKFLYIKPFISGSWMHFDFTAKNGYYKYAKENPEGSGKYEPIKDAQNISLSGDVISYQQDWLLLAAGFSIGTNILSPFSFDLSFQISPLTYCAATDNHFFLDSNYVATTKYIVYKDFSSFGLFIEPKVSFSLDLEKIKFSLDTSYRYISKTEGEAYYSLDNKKFYPIPNKAGAELSVMNLQFTVKVKL